MTLLSPRNMNPVLQAKCRRRRFRTTIFKSKRLFRCVLIKVAEVLAVPLGVAGFVSIGIIAHVIFS